jgi:hypothetical protein
VVDSGDVLAMLGRRRGHDGDRCDVGSSKVETASSIVSCEKGGGRLERV